MGGAQRAAQRDVAATRGDGESGGAMGAIWGWGDGGSRDGRGDGGGSRYVVWVVVLLCCVVGLCLVVVLPIPTYQLGSLKRQA